MWLLLSYPLVALGIVVVLLIVAIWLLPKLFRFITRVLRAFFAGTSSKNV